MITEAQLLAEISAQLPTNHANLITAATLRGVLNDMVSATFQPEGQSAITPLMYGAFADGTAHLITQADIDANTQWAEIYDVGTSWDTVAIQESFLAAVTNATPAPANGIKVTATSDTLPNYFFGNPEILVNGVAGGGIQVRGDGSVAGLFIKFSFKQGPVVITEVTMYQSTVNNQGDWKWQGSNDGTTWTDIGGSFTLGGALTQVQTSLNGNVTAYSQYRLLGVSGATVPSTTDIQEFTFKQGGVYVTGSRMRQYSWFSVVAQPMYIPPGTYWVNRTIKLNAQNFSLEFAERGSAIWSWRGEKDTIAFQTNSISYGRVVNLSIISNNPVNILWDMNGNGFYGGLKTQQITVYDMVLFGFSSPTGIAISRAGGSAQGDTIAFVNPYIAECYQEGLYIGGQNALSITLLNGDIQHCRCYGVNISGGSIFILGTSFQGQAAPLYVSPPDNQIVNGGADIYQPAGAGGTVISTARDIRSESEVLISSATRELAVDACAISTAGLLDSFQDYPYLVGHILKPSVNNTLRRSFIVTDDSGPFPGFKTFDATSSTTTKIVDPAAAYVVNAWVGFRLHFRFSNGFTEHHVISSNTATEIFLVGDPLSSPPNSLCLYHIGGITAAVAPNFDAATGGYLVFSGGALTGFTIAAGSNQLTCGSQVTPIGIGDYVVIPQAGQLFATGAGLRAPLIARLLAGANPYTISDAATVAINSGAGYWGTPLVDNQVSYIEIPYANLNGALGVSNTYLQSGMFYNFGSMVHCSANAIKFVGDQYNVPITTFTFDYRGNKEYRVADTITPAGVIDLTTNLSKADILTFTPDQNTTLNAPLPTATMSRRFSIHITTSGVVSFNITFGTNFISTGVLATGGVSGKIFVVTFENPGIRGDLTWHEVSRIGPM